ncbi:CgeB family protein [Agriterribacter sp.]|uniref:CgeB family protein n=1 Tax=Agriterribacter sp. TaxID=2821509 RepID=UPI002D0B558D|nr:glycosyltransferase [Agriterribacter sp.]HTN05244.1 glycosyltransferase [Agriterribacter sp.]
MKFLIPNYCVPDSFVDNVSFTLRATGHEVITLPPVDNKTLTSPYLRVLRKTLNTLTGTEITPQEKWLLANFKALKPDVVLTLTQPLAGDTLTILKDYHIKTIVWWGDTAANMKGKGILDEGWDLIFIKDGYAAHKLKTLGLPAFQLFEAMNPAWHKPLAEQQNNNLIIAGTFYDYRHFLTRRLLKDKVALELYGGRLPAWSDAEIKAIHTGKYVVREEKSRVFGAGMGVLNSTAMSEFDSVNCRAFEVAGTGALQIMEYRPAIEQCFEPGKEILVYKSYDELLELIERAIKYPAEMKKIREAGLKRAINEHTYRHRLEFILKKLQELK